jgi:putative cell wall-binding protein/predicted chitinase
MRWKSLVVGVLTGLVMLLIPLPALGQGSFLPAGETRLQGADRFETSVEISRRSFSGPIDAVYVATGRAYADALAGGPAAAHDEGPILLVDPGSIPGVVIDELDRLQPASIFILGGSSAVSTDVESLLGSYANSVVRLSGQDRYETATAVSQHIGSTAGTVFVASGATFADGLSGGAAAARLGGRLLLTKPGQLPASTSAELARVEPDRIYLLGGEAAVSLDVEAEVRAAAPDVAVSRLSGNDRYETSAAVARAVWPEGAAAMFFATGLDFADALSGTPAAHVNDAPVVLTQPDCLPTSIYRLRADMAPTTTVILGGQSAVAAPALETECGTSLQITSAMLQRVFGVSSPVVNEGLPSLNAEMSTGAINTAPRIAALLATLMAESSFRYNALEVGCTPETWYHPYCGRGYIQLTLKANYEAAGKYFSHDFVSNLDDARSLNYSAPIVRWYWTVTHNINGLADQLNMAGVTRAVNGSGASQATLVARCADFKNVLDYYGYPYDAGTVTCV